MCMYINNFLRDIFGYILQRKCHQYWPLGENYGDDEEMVFEDVCLKISLIEEKTCNYYIVRTLEIEDITVLTIILKHWDEISIIIWKTDLGDVQIKNTNLLDLN